MPNFQYKAKRGPQEIVQGEISAETEEDALNKITTMGLIPIKLEEATGAKPAATTSSASPQKKALQQVSRRTKPSKTPKAVQKPDRGSINKKNVRISSRDLNIFTRQFSILLKASVPLLKAFEVLQNQTQDPKFKSVLQDIQGELREGGSLSEVLSAYPRIFSQVYISMINSGEVSGTLDQVLMRLSEFAERESEIRSKVKAALIYPMFLFLVGIGTIFVLLTFVMPRLMVVFGDLGTELPNVTKAVIAASEFCQAYWMWIFGVIGAVIVWFRTRGLSEIQQTVVDGFAMMVPGFGALIEKSEISKFLRSIELLYENGIPLYQAVEVGMKTISNRVIRAEFVKVPGLLEGGDTLAKSLSEVKYISDFVTNMVSVGEESGQLGLAVGETASFFEQETNQFIKVATSLLEPFMILTVGLIVGFIVIAMLLPIFEIHVLAS